MMTRGMLKTHSLGSICIGRLPCRSVANTERCRISVGTRFTTKVLVKHRVLFNNEKVRILKSTVAGVCRESWYVKGGVSVGAF